MATETSLSRADLVEKAKEVATTLKQDNPETVLPGQAFVGDLRATSALCVGDGISNHSAKWLQKELGVSKQANSCDIFNTLDLIERFLQHHIQPLITFIRSAGNSN